jgi:hypothetical protein
LFSHCFEAKRKIESENEAKRNKEETKRSEKSFFFFSLRSETKNLKRNEAKTSEKLSPLFSLEHAKTKRNESRFASFRFEAKKKFKQNRRTLVERTVYLT